MFSQLLHIAKVYYSFQIKVNPLVVKSSQKLALRQVDFFIIRNWLMIPKLMILSSQALMGL